MQRSHHILWGEGVFLRPQHFQQQDIHIQSQIGATADLSRAYPWGAREIRIDTDALAVGVLRATALSLRLADGTNIEAPASARLPPSRNLEDLQIPTSETTVYFGIPVLSSFGGNSLQPADAVASSRSVRYTREQVSIPDLHTHALAADVATLLLNGQLLLEHENRDDWVCLPIARLARNAAGNWEPQPSHIPPLLDTSASTTLVHLVKRLLDILNAKSQALTQAHRERTASIVEYGSADIGSFWLLHSINQTFPVLQHYARHRTHPEQLYLAMVRFAGELVTFSSSPRLHEIPHYDHLDLGRTFATLDSLIRELLETVISSRYAVIPLVNTKQSFYIGRLDSDRLIENVDYYLSVASDLPTTDVIGMVPTKLKIGAPDDVEKTLNSALAGIRLEHATQTPAPLPVRAGNHYFAFDSRGTMFERMQAARCVCIYVPQVLLQSRLELIAVFR